MRTTFRAVLCAIFATTSLAAVVPAAQAAPTVVALSTAEYLGSGGAQSITLTPIEISTAAKFATVTLQVSDPSVAEFGESASVDSGLSPSIPTGSGGYSVSGTIDDVNALLQGVVLNTNDYMNRSFSISTQVNLSTGVKFAGVKPVWVAGGISGPVANLGMPENYVSGIKHRMQPMMFDLDPTDSVDVQISLQYSNYGALGTDSPVQNAPLVSIGPGTWEIQGTVSDVSRVTSNLTFLSDATGDIPFDVSVSGPNIQTSISSNFHEVTLSQCGAGSYSQTGDDSVTTCFLASPGFYVGEEGSTLPLPCPAGTYAGSFGTTSCTVAEIGYFSPEGSINQTMCDSSFTRNTGTTSANDCISPSSLKPRIIPWHQSGIYAPDGKFGIFVPAAAQAGSLRMTLMKLGGSYGFSMRTIDFRNPGSAGFITNYRNYYLNILGDNLPRMYDGSLNQLWYVIRNVTDSGGAFSPGVSSFEREGRYSVTISYVTSDGVTVEGDPLTIDLGTSGTCGNGRYAAMDLSSQSFQAYSFLNGYTCMKAPLGFKAVDGAKVACPAGTFTAEEQSTDCTEAEVGHYVPGEASSYQIACEVGTYANATGKTSCDAVPQGTFANSEKSALTECLAGSYQPVDGFKGSSCTLASPGYYVLSPRSSSQTQCSLGSYQSQSGQSSCVQALAGFYVDTVGATTQKACPTHFTSSPGSTSKAGCLPMGCIMIRGKAATAACLLVPLGYTVSKTSTVTYTVTSSGTAKCAVVKGVVVPAKAGECTVRVTIKPKTGQAVVKDARIFAS